MFQILVFLQDQDTKALSLFDNSTYCDDLQTAYRVALDIGLPYQIINTDTYQTMGYSWQWWLHCNEITY